MADNGGVINVFEEFEIFLHFIFCRRLSLAADRSNGEDYDRRFEQMRPL